MKLRAVTAVLVDNAWHKAGDVFEVNDAAGCQLVELGWAEKMADEAVKAPKKTATKKKAAAKK